MLVSLVRIGSPQSQRCVANLVSRQKHWLFNISAVRVAKQNRNNSHW